MQTREKLTLPPMGCGTWAWGNRLLWGYDQSMDTELQAVFNLCVSNGVSLFDTGDSYGTGKLNGRSEQLLGKFSQAYQGNNQDNIYIATKLAAYPWRLTPQSMVSACQASAKRLGRKVDLAQMHWSTANYAPWQEKALLDGLAKLYQQDLVRGVGLSNYGTKRLRWAYQRFADAGVPISTLQIQYSLLSTYPVTQLGLKDVCDELGIKIIAYSPLALGILTGKYSATGKLPPGIRGFLFKSLLSGVQPLLECLQEIAEARKKTMAQVAINWCICKGTIPIPGAKSQKQAQENIGALGWYLDTNEVAELDIVAGKLDKVMVQNIFQTT
ncbi:aldo/keto reductase [Calothrix sp. 336/3]|uniref:aldo/keto reductase n=1 Tax=Calothrix sp. 336/3 TaxID=1337936 RepID=UPI0004E37D46|nr:aldo/keto reductase [Calothrix sp. 336/3]AKG23435.1 aldo/keto reductase [Calothrix sp. 336/3]